MSDETKLKFFVSWTGEAAAGIRPGFEEVTISFRYGQPIDDEAISYWRDSLKDFFDGASVLTEPEFAAECKANNAMWDD